MNPDQGLIGLIVSLQVLHIVVHELQIPEINHMLVLAMRQNKVDGFRLEEVESLFVTINLFFQNAGLNTLHAALSDFLYYLYQTSQFNSI